jgi:hypothetical protein
MPWQEGLLWRLRHPSLLKYLFIVLTMYSSNVGGKGSFGAVREVVCSVLGLKREREVHEEQSTEMNLHVVENHFICELPSYPTFPGGTACGSTCKLASN